MDKQTNFIVLRGPAASGKSTVAQALQNRSDRKIVILEQDYYRHTLLKGSEDSGDIAAKMMQQNALTALEAGYDVITDGIFRIDKYKALFDEIIQKHTKNNYMFLFDISFDETVNRHKGREKAALFGENDMKEWYYAAEPSGYEFEYKISETWNEEQTIEFIRNETGL